MSSFDYGERSLKKYSTQLDGLNKKLEVQKTVTESARKHYEKMVAEHGEGSRQAQNAAAAYNHEATQLNNLERHIQKVTKEMKEFERQQAIQNSTLYKSGDALVNFGDKLGDISSKARQVGGSLTRYLTAPIMGLVTAVGGMGFKRAMDIEQVQMMMEHISDDSKEYEKRMENVVDLVTDTRFGTAEIGNEYAKFIGASASDVGARLYSEVAMNLASFKSDDQLIPQIGDLFTKSLQSGKIDGGMINQFTNAGVDILKVLGNKWGTTTEDVRKRLSEGSIDIHEVLDELSHGILEGTEGELGVTKAMGGMLEKSGRTLSGQIKNFFAAISQTGERLIKDTGLFDGVKNALDELREMLKSGELDSILIPTFQGISKAMEALVDIARKMFKWFSSLDDSTKEWIGKLVGLAIVIGPIITGLGIFGGIIAKISTGLGNFLKFLAPVFQPLSKFGLAAGDAGKKVGLLSRVFTFLTGPIGIVIGVLTILGTVFVTLYKKSETFREMLQNIWKIYKNTFLTVLDSLMPIFQSIKEFFGDLQKKFQEFMKVEGPGIQEAFENIKDVFKVVGEFLADKVVGAFEVFQKTIEFVMPYVVDVITWAWGKSQILLSTGLDVFLGGLKIFSGLFTGDWDKMWEGIFDIGKSIMGTIWKFMKDTWIGKMITSITGFDGNFNMTIEDMWKNIKKKFSDKIIEIFNNLKKTFIGRIITNVVSFALNFRQNISDMWQRIKDTFTQKITEIRGKIANSFVGRMLTSVRDLKTNFVKIAKDMWSGVKEQFNNIVEGAKALPGRIGKGISDAKDKATDGMIAVGNKLIEWAGKPFNKVVDGVNWITGKLGVDKKIAKWDYPQYAKGTDKKGHPGGWAMVGEKGRELIQLPSGKSIISPDSHTMMNLPKGTHVIPNKPTEKILKSDLPHYAKGTGLWEGIKDVWDYISNPSKLVDSVMNKISVASNLAPIPKAIVSGGFNYLKTKPYEYIKELFSESGGGGKPAFGWPVTSPFGYRTHPISGTRKLHGGVDFGAPAGSPVPSTTGGTVSFASGGWNGGFGNLVKVRQGMWEMFYAHLSKILVSAGQSVKKGDILGLVGSTGASTGPHLHYETRKNGVRVNPMSLKGFKTGGVIKSKMMAMLGEDGEEIVIPTAKNRRTDAMKLLALAAKKIGVEGGNYTRPNNVGDSNGDDSKVNEMIRLLLEQNEHLKKSNELLTALLGKDLDLYKLTGKIDGGLNNLSDRRRAAMGG